MEDFTKEHIKSKEYTQADIIKRMIHPITEVNFKLEVEPPDFMFEDTIPVYISMPRLAWKILHGCAESSKTTAGGVASEWLTDTAIDMFKNLKSNDETAQTLASRLKEMRELKTTMDKAKSMYNNLNNNKEKKK